MRIFTKISLKKVLFTNTHSTTFQVVRTELISLTVRVLLLKAIKIRTRIRPILFSLRQIEDSLAHKGQPHLSGWRKWNI